MDKMKSNISKEEILEQIKHIELDIKNLEESSRSAYVNEGILNQVRIRVEELNVKKNELEKELNKFVNTKISLKLCEK